MKIKELTFPTAWDVNAIFKQFETENSTTLVVEFPGANYSTELPLFHYTRKLAFQFGFDVLSLEYGYQSARLKPEINNQLIESIVSDLEHAFKTMDIQKYKKVIFLSKSLGTCISGLLAEKLGMDVKHIFLTPVSHTIPFIHDHNCLVVTGTEDPVFTEVERNQITGARMHVVDGANHGMEVPDAMKSLEIMKGILEQVDKYYVDLSGEAEDQ
ncbi:hypothetical protein [Paenibacillus sp.]|uniref:hypothetical protein n=1 Tax=Paenibacillus sp. TaxID=58172 RepID=UPI00281FCAAE|nr:hypothetical protein [Paenibacillus sp.]MDR0271286.1 hypothetical protein [Paenibacillus sp.]